jgi:hypothetical protein
MRLAGSLSIAMLSNAFKPVALMQTMASVMYLLEASQRSREAFHRENGLVVGGSIPLRDVAYLLKLKSTLSKKSR